MKTKLTTFSTLTLIALLHPLLAIAQQTPQTTSPQPEWYWPGPWHMWGGGWGFWWIFPLLFMLFMLLACAAMFLFGHRSGGGHGAPWHMMSGPWGSGRPWSDPTHSALQILNERFAKGEIQKQEYEEKKALILSGGQR